MPKTYFKLSVLSTSILLSSHILAQDNDISDNNATDTEYSQTTELETIKVTSSNKSRNTEKTNSMTISAMQTTTGLILSPKETPQSVSVITNARLKKESINTMQDALKTATGINVIKEANRYRFQSRGFYLDQIQEDGLSSTVPGSSSNTYRESQSMTDLVVYDHIEVVRGATGLTQANGEPGGTINAVKKRPTQNFQIQGNVLVNSFGKTRTTFDISGPFSQFDGLRGRLVAAIERDPTSLNLPRANKQGVIYGVIDKDLGENTTITLGFLYQNMHTTPNIFGVPMGIEGAELGFNRDTYLGYNWNRYNARKYNIFLETNTYINDDWKLNNKLSFTKSNSTEVFGFITNTGTSYAGLPSGGTLATNWLSNYINSGKQISLQSNLTGQYRLLNREHDLFITYNYSNEYNETRFRRRRDTTAYDPFTFTGNEIASPNWESNDANNNGYHDQIFYDTSTSSTGIAIGTRFNPTDNLHIIAGTRWARWQTRGNTYYNWWNGEADSDPNEYSGYSRSRFVPYLGITYDLTPNQSIYASYTSIFKPQYRKDINGNILAPVLGDNYEIGWKTEWFGGKLNTAVDIFQIVQHNRAISRQTTVDSKTVTYYEPIGKVRSRGFDIEIAGHLTNNWQLFLGYTYNRSKYLNTESSSYTAGSNFNKHTPVHLLRFYTSYTLPFANRKWTIGTGLTVQSKTESLYKVKQAGYTLWNADIQYRFNEHTSLSLIARNIGDKRYYETSKIRTFGANNIYGERRNFTLNFDWKF